MGLSERSSSSLSDILLLSESSSVASTIDSGRYDDDVYIGEDSSTDNTPSDDKIIGIPRSSKHYQLASSTSSSHDDESVEYKSKGRFSGDKGKGKASFNDSSDSFIGTFNPGRRKKRAISSSSSSTNDNSRYDVQLFNSKTSASNALPAGKSQDLVKNAKGKKKKRKSRICMKPPKRQSSKRILSPYLSTPLFDVRERARTAATPGVDRTIRAAVSASQKCEHSVDGLREAQKVYRKLHGSPNKFRVGTGQNITIPQRPQGAAIANGGSRQANYRSKQCLSLELTPVVPKAKSRTAGTSYSHGQLLRPTPHLAGFPKPKKLNLSHVADTSQQPKPISCTSGYTHSSLPKQKKPKVLQINV